MKDSQIQQIESDLLDAIDLAQESFYRLCIDLNLLHAYQFALEYGESLYPSISFSEVFRHLNNSISEELRILKSALNSFAAPIARFSATISNP